MKQTHSEKLLASRNALEYYEICLDCNDDNSECNSCNGTGIVTPEQNAKIASDFFSRILKK